jgi:hypothetical protein
VSGRRWPAMTGHGAMARFSVETSDGGPLAASPDFMVHGSWLHRNAAGAFQCRAPAWTAAEAPMVGMLHRRSSAVEVCGQRAILAFGIRQVTHRTSSTESDMPQICAAKRREPGPRVGHKGSYPRGHGSAKASGPERLIHSCRFLAAKAR